MILIHRFVAFAVLALSLCTARGQTITVYSSGTVERGTSRQLTGYVPLSPNTVTWSVNGIVGGDATFGTVSQTGLYNAPADIPVNNVVAVRATSTAYPAKFGEAAITITQPQVWLWSVAPTKVPAGSFTITVNGSNFHAGSVIQFGGVALPTTFISATGLRATGVVTAAQAGTSVNITIFNTGLGGMTSTAVKLAITAPVPVKVTLSPATASVTTATTRQFAASVTGSSNTTVTWSVNGMAGGDATVGAVTVTGLYTAPATVPAPAPVTVRATSVADPAISGQAVVTVQLPPPPVVAVTPMTASIQAAKAQQFLASVTGTANTAVTWSVNAITGGNTSVGTISATGLYTAPASVPNPASVTIRAKSVANPAAGAAATLTITQPPGGGVSQGTENLSAGRFLEQAAFGPTPVELDRVKTLGVNAWLDGQFALPESAIATTSGNMGLATLQAEYLNRLAQAPDQLRQRVAAALGQIIVISINKNSYPDEMVPYLRILSRNAFGNYRTLLDEISHSSQMGKYLDLANSNKPTAGSAANENYARELMQLFTIGLYTLKPDGTRQLDALGNPIRAYDQATVQQVALALTGWTFPGPGNNNWENFSGPLEAREVNHDTRAKTLVGLTLPGGQTAEADMAATLNWLFNHQNIAPFVATRLIRALVTSNPTPAFVARIAAVFADNGAGVRGDLRAVVRAILTDPEARNDVPAPAAGRLKDPVYHAAAFVRALGGSISATNQQAWTFNRMSQTPLAPASVFGFYSPLFRIPRSSLNGPEFQIYGPTESVLRGNLFWQILTNPGADFPVDIAPFVNLAGNTVALIDAVDQTLLYGRMPAAMRQSLANAINAQSDPLGKAQTAIYLAALSGYYAVQY
ncbi:MAG: DUF1800 domain-containing protein [Undibacterium sp.]|nr:DUF1800 domain-containing protein [Opitutaceae bacterium]